MKHTDKKIAWITGGSAGIGAETAKELAKEGWTVCISARSVEGMDNVIKQAEGFAGHIKAYALDVTNQDQALSVIDAIENEVGTIDMAILNAGMYESDKIDNFDSTLFKKHFEVNAFGVANCLDPILKRFIKRNAGHICIVASVAGYRGLPGSLSYGPTKAALINLAESLAIEAKGTNIKVQVANPGFVKTRLTDKNEFDMPLRISVEEAAQKFVKGLKSNKFEINFPLSFALILKTLGALPNFMYLWLLKKIKV